MVKIDKIIPGGQALGVGEDGKKIFFWNALPGELVVNYQITKNKAHYLEAIATEVADLSPYRVQPLDSASYLSTSPWQIIDYSYELQLKQELVVEVFREHQIDLPIPPIHTDGQEYFYRNKMEYALYWDNNLHQISLAFHARGSHRKIPITSSSIEHPEIFSTAKKIVQDLNANHAEARLYQSLLLRCSQKGEVSGGLYENRQPHPTFNQLTDTILGRAYTYSPNGFFQINLPVYEMALTEIKKHVTSDHILDLYAGVGTIGLSVAPDRHLTLVECDKSAFNELANNCEGVSLAGSSWRLVATKEQAPATSGWLSDAPERMPLAILAKSEDALSYIAPDQTVILDPPRAGCDRKLIERLLEVAPPTIIYLSCNPATQARDVKALLCKYHLTTVQTFNFFPHTPHIENLVVLSL